MFLYIDEELGIDLIFICWLDIMVMVVDVNCFVNDICSEDLLVDCDESVDDEDECIIVDLFID